MTENAYIHLTPRQKYWLNHIQQCKESGQSMRAYAKAHDLNRNSLYTAHRKLKLKGVIADRQPAQRFQKLAVRPTVLAPMVKITCPNGFIIEAHAEISSLQPFLKMVSAIQ